MWQGFVRRPFNATLTLLLITFSCVLCGENYSYNTYDLSYLILWNILTLPMEMHNLRMTFSTTSISHP